ncbi:hypothetical protein [Actinomadura kijaniata]|uniref:hypothetical protein n=1 Tax=Actinomadura kijaniata TaxID=46161 RepID=UPI003F52BB83
MLHFTEPVERDALLNLARTADARLRANPAYRADLPTRTTVSPFPDGGGHWRRSARGAS